MNKNAEFIAWLKRAKALVEKGWTQGAYHRGECCCAQAAMADTVPKDAPGFLFTGPGSHCGLVYWNDTPGRTKAEVIAMFDNSIKALEEV